MTAASTNSQGSTLTQSSFIFRAEWALVLGKAEEIMGLRLTGSAPRAKPNSDLTMKNTIAISLNIKYFEV